MVILQCFQLSSGSSGRILHQELCSELYGDLWTSTQAKKSRKGMGHLHLLLSRSDPSHHDYLGRACLLRVILQYPDSFTDLTNNVEH